MRLSIATVLRVNSRPGFHEVYFSLWLKAQRRVSRAAWGQMNLPVLFYVDKNLKKHLPYFRGNPKSNECNRRVISVYHERFLMFFISFGKRCPSRWTLDQTPTPRHWVDSDLGPSHWHLLTPVVISVSYWTISFCQQMYSKRRKTRKEFAHLNMSLHQCCSIIRVHPWFQSKRIDLTLSSHLYIIAVPWILYAHIF